MRKILSLTLTVVWLLWFSTAYTQQQINQALSVAISPYSVDDQLIKLNKAIPKLAKIQLANTSKELLEVLVFLWNAINVTIQKNMQTLYPQKAELFGDIEKEMFMIMNSYRQDKWLWLLKENIYLNQAAQMLADDMAKWSFLDHVTPLGVWYIQRLEYVWYEFQYISENLWEWNVSASDIVHLRSISPIHLVNLYNQNATEVGVGYNKEKHYRVAVYAKPI